MLTNVVLPKGIGRIEYRTFYGCSKLDNIDLPKSVKWIGKGAFYECFFSIKTRIIELLTKH